MRVVAVAIVALAIYFAASLLWPAHDRSVVQGAVPPREAAHGGTYARDLLARAAPRDADAYAAAVTQLAALGEDDASAALGAWMESHVWRRLLGQADAVPAIVADAIAAGRGVAPALADLRAQVLAKSLRLEVDETADAASAAAAHDERMPPDAVAPAAVAPGLWSHRRPRGDYEMRLALRVTNTAGTPIGPFRLVVAWNGHDDQRLACERRAAGTAAIAPGGAATVWCRDLGGDGRQLPVSDPARWRGDGSAPNRPVAIASGSTLDFPELDVRIPGFDQHTFFLRDLRGASISRCSPAGSRWAGRRSPGAATPISRRRPAAHRSGCCSARPRRFSPGRCAPRWPIARSRPRCPARAARRRRASASPRSSAARSLRSSRSASSSPLWRSARSSTDFRTGAAERSGGWSGRRQCARRGSGVHAGP